VLGENDTLVNMTFSSGRTPIIGTVVGGNTTTTDGKYRKGMAFNGSQHIVVPGFNTTQTGTTFSFWVKPAGIARAGLNGFAPDGYDPLIYLDP